MKIKIIRTPPIDPELGLEEGQIHIAKPCDKGCWVLGRGGEPAKLLIREYEILDRHDQEVPSGFYVMRGPDRLVVGLEISRGNPFRNARLPQLLRLALAEQARLRASWTDGDDREKWDWDTKLRVSMSKDMIRLVDADLEDGAPYPSLNETARKLSRVLESENILPVTTVRNVTRPFIEIVILIIKEPDASSAVPAA